MLYNNLKDVIKHTFSLGFIEAVKITDENDETHIKTISPDKSVVVYGTLKNQIEDLEDESIGFSRMSILKGMIDFPPFGESGAKIEIKKQKRPNNTEAPTEILFQSEYGHSANYRFMSNEATNEQISVPPFKGVKWDITIEPTAKNLKDLSYFAGVLGAYEPTFEVVFKNNNLEFHIGSGGSDRSVVPITKDVDGSLSHQWSWPLMQVLSILKLSESSICTMSLSDQGALKIDIDSGLGNYEYILPARAK